MTNKELKGIDVSKWQGDIDWSKVKASGISFAMIRLGYGSSDGTQCGVDSYFHKNVVNAVKAGVNVGCYFYSYAMSVEAARKEAQFVVNTLKNYKGVFTYPISFDLEDPKQQSLGKTVLTNMVIAFGADAFTFTKQVPVSDTEISISENFKCFKQSLGVSLEISLVFASSIISAILLACASCAEALPE